MGFESICLEWKQFWDTFTCVRRLICPEGCMSSLNRSNPIQSEASSYEDKSDSTWVLSDTPGCGLQTFFTLETPWSLLSILLRYIVFGAKIRDQVMYMLIRSWFTAMTSHRWPEVCWLVSVTTGWTIISGCNWTMSSDRSSCSVTSSLSNGLDGSKYFTGMAFGL